MAQLFEKLEARKTVLSVSSGISKSDLIITDPRAGTADPHIWFDTRIWMNGMEHIMKELSHAYPKYRRLFETNFATYKRKVEQMQEELRLQLTAIPSGQRVLITSHDAFHYFGRCFHVKVKALQGISTTQEPGVQDVVNLVNFIVKNKVKALFVEHSVSPKAIKTVIESCQRKGHRVRIGGTLYSDALGDQNGPGNTYLKMLRYNVLTLTKGLK
jgi:manganese/zinc/iron transport system substrate-binding protein